PVREFSRRRRRRGDRDRLRPAGRHQHHLAALRRVQGDQLERENRRLRPLDADALKGIPWPRSDQSSSKAIANPATAGSKYCSAPTTLSRSSTATAKWISFSAHTI